MGNWFAGKMGWAPSHLTAFRVPSFGITPPGGNSGPFQNFDVGSRIYSCDAFIRFEDPVLSGVTVERVSMSVSETSRVVHQTVVVPPGATSVLCEDDGVNLPFTIPDYGDFIGLGVYSWVVMNGSAADIQSRDFGLHGETDDTYHITEFSVP